MLQLAHYRALLDLAQVRRNQPQGTTTVNRDALFIQQDPRFGIDFVGNLAAASRIDIPTSEANKDRVQKLIDASGRKDIDVKVRASCIEHPFAKSCRRLCHVLLTLENIGKRVVEVGPRNRDNVILRNYSFGRHFIAPTMTLDDGKTRFVPALNQTVCQCILTDSLCKCARSRNPEVLLLIDVYLSQAEFVIHDALTSGVQSVYWACCNLPDGNHTQEGIVVHRANGRLLMTTDSGDKIYNDYDYLNQIASIMDNEHLVIGVYRRCGIYTIYEIRLAAPNLIQTRFPILGPDWEVVQGSSGVIVAPTALVMAVHSKYFKLHTVTPEAIDIISNAASSMCRPEVTRITGVSDYDTNYAAVCIAVDQINRAASSRSGSVIDVLRRADRARESITVPTLVRKFDMLRSKLQTFLEIKEISALCGLLRGSGIMDEFVSSLLEKMSVHDDQAVVELSRNIHFMCAAGGGGDHYRHYTMVGRNHEYVDWADIISFSADKLPSHMSKFNNPSLVNPLPKTSDGFVRLFNVSNVEEPELIDRNDPESFLSIIAKRLCHPLAEPTKKMQDALFRAADQLVERIRRVTGTPQVDPMDFQIGLPASRPACESDAVRPFKSGKTVAVISLSILGIYLMWKLSSRRSSLNLENFATSLVPETMYSNAYSGQLLLPVASSCTPFPGCGPSPQLPLGKAVQSPTSSSDARMCWKSITPPGTQQFPHLISSSLTTYINNCFQTCQTLAGFSPSTPFQRGATAMPADIPSLAPVSQVTATQPLETVFYTGVTALRCLKTSPTSILHLTLRSISKLPAMMVSLGSHAQKLTWRNLHSLVNRLRLSTVSTPILLSSVAGLLCNAKWMACRLIDSIGYLVALWAELVLRLTPFRRAQQHLCLRKELWRKFTLAVDPLLHQPSPNVCTNLPFSIPEVFGEATGMYAGACYLNSLSRFVKKYCPPLACALPNSMVLVSPRNWRSNHTLRLRYGTETFSIPYLTLSQMIALSGLHGAAYCLVTRK